MNRKIKLFGVLLLVVCLTVTVAGTGMGSGVKSDMSTVTAGDHLAPNEFFFDNETEYPRANNESGTPSTSSVPSTTGLSDNVGEKVSDFVDEKFGDWSNIGGDVQGIGEAVSNFIGSDAVGQFGDTLSGFVEGFGQLGSGIGDIFGNIGSGGSIFSSLLGGGSTTAAYPTASHTSSYIEPVVTKAQGASTTKSGAPAAPATTHGATVDYALQAVPYTKPTGEIKAGDKGDGVKWLQWIFIFTHYGLRDDGITGVMDEDTVAVVKKLQQERGFEVNGKVDQKLLDAAEALYYQYKNNTATTVSVPTSEAASAPAAGNNGAGAGKSTIIIGAIIIGLIWLVAIALIVFILVFRKRKKLKNKNGREMTALEKAVESGSGEFKSAEKPEAKPEEKTAEVKPTEEVKAEAPAENNANISNLSDLFDEANNGK